MGEDVEYILIYSYHDDNYEVYKSLSLLKLALASLKETFKNNSDFHYKVYCGKNITSYIDDLEKSDK